MGSKSVLVVEDDTAIREVIKNVLEFEGYQVFTAQNGREGVEVLRATEAKPGLILLDLMMPVMNGWEFLARHREDPELGKIPVIVISASADLRQPEGATGLFRKPFDIPALLGVAQRFCDDSATA